MNIKLGAIIKLIALSIVTATVCPALGYASPDVSPNISPDVLIDVGHGGIDGGTKHGQWLEKDINLTMSKLLEKSLNKRHIRAVRNRTSDMPSAMIIIG